MSILTNRCSLIYLTYLLTLLTPDAYNMVKKTIKILQQILPDFKQQFERFVGMRCSRNNCNCDPNKT